MFSVAPICATCSLTIPIIFLITGIHPFQYILEEILPDAKYRSISTMIAITVIKFILLYLSALESFRCGAYLYATLLVLLDRFRKILKIPTLTCTNASRIYQIHTEYYLLWRKLEHTLQFMNYVVTTYTFWNIVILTWICVKCSAEQIGNFMYVWFLIALCLLVLGTTVVVSLTSQIFHMDYIIVKINAIRARRDVIQKTTWTNKITLKCTLACHPIRMKYGTFYWIGKDYFAEFFSVLLLRCFDAIELFNY